MTAVISDLSWVDYTWLEFVSCGLFKPGRESRLHHGRIRLDGVCALTGLFEVFLVVSDYIFVSMTIFLFQ